MPKSSLLKLETWKLIVDALSEGVIVADRLGRLVYFNPAAKRLVGLGITKEPLKNWSQRYGVFFPDQTTPFPAKDLPLARAIRGLKTDEQHLFVRNAKLPKGIHLASSGRALRDGKRGLVGGIVSLRDLTASRKEEASRRETETLLDSVVENIPDMIFIKDAKTLRFAHINKAGEDLLGRSRKELIGKSDHDLFPKDEADFFTMKDRQVLKEKRLEVIPEEPIETPHGQRILRTKKIPLLDGSGKPRYLVGISDDITETKRREEEIRELQARLQEQVEQLTSANQDLEAFNNSVSHDLRRPLAHVSGYAELVLKQSGHLLPPNARQQLETIEASAKRMGLLLEKLLLFSRMGRESLRPTAIDLERMAREVAQELEKDVADRRVEWDFGALPSVEGDETMLRLALINLLGNALKYTRDRDPAKITLAPEPAPPGMAGFKIADNGAGFAQEDAAALFQPFQRLHPLAEFEGTGIGLATVRRIVERHGGSVRAEGRPQAGAVFHITLPEAKPAALSAGSGRGSARPRRAPGRA